MHVEKRKVGNKTKYYLIHNYREGTKVRKVSRYLGSDLPKERLEKIRLVAEKQILQRVKVIKRINDPLLEALSEEELEQIKKLEHRKEFKIFHLSEEQWKRFSELFTYSTNAIEGSELSKNEVRDILEKDKWPKDKDKEDISEAYGMQEAIEYIRKTKGHISIELMEKTHEIIFRNSKEFAGKLRAKGTEVIVRDGLGNVVHEGAPSEKVRALLKNLIVWYEKYKNKYPPILLASVVHNQFENIHPFEDGNGRVGRLLLNNILLKHNLPPVNISLKRRRRYYQALTEYENNHDIRPTIELILDEYKSLKKELGGHKK
ncbi:MAG: Fic family protein [Candidatus Diapherotrites archaeon]